MTYRWAIACAVAVMLAACGSGKAFYAHGTSTSVGVDALIEIEQQSEDVHVVNVDLMNLPPPERHDPNMRNFVVWVTPSARTGDSFLPAANYAPQRMGRLAYNPDERRGTLSCTTPNEAVFIQVTVEDTPNPAAPSQMVVVNKHVFVGSGQQ